MTSSQLNTAIACNLWEAQTIRRALRKAQGKAKSTTARANYRALANRVDALVKRLNPKVG